MTVPFAPHVRVTALGRLGSASGERFSYGLNLTQTDNAGPFELGPNQAVWDDIAADIRAFHVATQTRISFRAVLEEVKFASIGVDGRYTADPVIVNVVDAPGGGPQTPQIIPQSAVAISLASARRGPSGRGRFYIPMPSCDLDAATLRMDPQEALGIRDQAKTLIDNVNNAPGIDVLGLAVCVSSSKGYNSPVTGVRVGRTVDTIRSRRTSIPEDYTAVAAIA